MIIYEQRGFEVKNPSPFLMTILKMKKLREEMARFRTQRILRNEALKIDREFMEK